MPATIRLKRVGRKKQSAFRIVVTESSTSVEGPAVENLGIYQPRTEPSLVRLDAERTLHWLRDGAMPSDTVRSLLRRTGVWESYHEGIAPEELEQKIVILGPSDGRQTTSRRAEAAEAGQEAREGTGGEDGEGDGTEEPSRDGPGEAVAETEAPPEAQERREQPAETPAEEVDSKAEAPPTDEEKGTEEEAEEDEEEETEEMEEG